MMDLLYIAIGPITIEAQGSGSFSLVTIKPRPEWQDPDTDFPLLAEAADRLRDYEYIIVDVAPISSMAAADQRMIVAAVADMKKRYSGTILVTGSALSSHWIRLDLAIFPTRREAIQHVKAMDERERALSATCGRGRHLEAAATTTVADPPIPTRGIAAIEAGVLKWVHSLKNMAFELTLFLAAVAFLGTYLWAHLAK
jgi:hypothetical protein